MPEAILSLSNVTKQFGALLASDNVSLDLMPGEIHALIGPNGAGKSTLIKQIAGEIKPDSGDIRFGGRDIGDLDAVERSRMGLARTFQVSSLMPEFSVLQNVVLAQQSVSGKIFRFFQAGSERCVVDRTGDGATGAGWPCRPGPDAGRRHIARRTQAA